jgi:hypothetical protein
VDEVLAFLVGVGGVVLAAACLVTAVGDWRASRRPGAPNGARRILVVAFVRKQAYLLLSQCALLFRAAVVLWAPTIPPTVDLDGWGQAVRWVVTLASLGILFANAAYLRARHRIAEYDGGWIR